MPRIPPLLADALLAGAIATAIAVIWIYPAGGMGPYAVVICTVVYVAVSFAVPAAVGEIRRRRRAPLIRRWNTHTHRKPRPLRSTVNKRTIPPETAPRPTGDLWVAYGCLAASLSVTAAGVWLVTAHQVWAAVLVLWLVPGLLLVGARARRADTKQRGGRA